MNFRDYFEEMYANDPEYRKAEEQQKAYLDLCDKVFRARHHQNLNIKDVAFLSGVSRKVISEFEMMCHMPRKATVRKIFAALGLAVTDEELDAAKVAAGYAIRKI